MDLEMLNIYNSSLKAHQDVFCAGFVPPDLKVFRRLQELIEGNFKDEHSSAHYANQIGLSIKVLNKIVHHYTGFTVRLMIERRVFTEAANLLKYTQMSVKEIGYDVGLNDPMYFSRRFKMIYGLSPIFYRLFEQKKMLDSY